MCGRYTLTLPGSEIAAFFDLPGAADYDRRYNIAPTQEAPVIRVFEEVDGAGTRRLDLLRWGLVPFWADDPSIGNRMINARSETAADKPAFRASFKRRRCLVVADGFYEWKKESGGKQPYWIHRPDGAPMAFAGLWSRWDKEDEDDPLETYTILTRDAHQDIRHIHPRMPVVLAKDDFTPWLDPTLIDKDALNDILRHSEGGGLETRRVSRRVNSPSNDRPEVLEEQAG